MAVDKFLAWLNCNIELLDEKSRNAGPNSMHDKRRCRYKRDILQEARDQYLKNRSEASVSAQTGNSTPVGVRSVGGARIRIVGVKSK